MTGPYADITLFLRTVELGSLRAAARDAAIEPSNVSRRLTRLENRLGTQLIERAAGRSRPTPAGLRYYEQMRSLMAQIAAVESDVAGEAEVPRGLLRVNAPIDFGQRHVAAWLLEFARQNPGVDVQLTLSSQFVDIRSEGIDIAIRVGRLQDSSLKATKLADVPRVLVASREYLSERGVPGSPEDLEEFDHVFFAPANRSTPLLLVGPDGKTHKVNRRGRVTVNAVYSVVEAVAAGFGVHAGPRWAFQPAIESGELIELLPDYRQQSLPMNAIWSPAVLLPARIRVFLDFLRAAVREVGGLEPAGLF